MVVIVTHLPLWFVVYFLFGGLIELHESIKWNK